MNFIVALFFSLNALAGELVVQGISERIASLDPFASMGIEEYSLRGHVTESLAYFDPYSRELLPCLAESWVVEGRRVRVNLRKNVTFQNGANFTAEDVKFTLDAFYDPKFKGEVWRSVWSAIEKAEVIGPHQIDFVMKERRYETFKNLMVSLRILSKTAYAKSTKTWRDSNLVGTGPFRVKRFDSGRHVDLEPNSSWWASEKPAFALRVKTVTDFTLAEMMFQKKELDFYAVPEGASGAAKSSNVRRLVDATGSGLVIDLNLRRPIFQDARVRRALVMFWDRKALNEKLFQGRREVAIDGFSPVMAHYPPGSPIAYDAKKAAAELARAGWRDHDKDSVLDRDGERLEFTLFIHSADDERWASLYQADAAKVGVKVNLKRVDEDVQWWKLLREGKFDAIASGGGVSDEVHFGAWHSKGEYAYYGFKNAAVDRALEALQIEFDPKKRAVLHRRLIELVRAETPRIPGLFSRHANFLVSPRIEVDEKFPTQAWRWRQKN